MAGQVVTAMDFGQSFPLDPLPSGWRHPKFWTRTPMSMAFAIKDGVPSMRFETDDSASMLFRHVDINLATYPMLVWRWYIELSIRSPLDERTREGDDHPARLFLRFMTDRGQKRAMEVIWGNRLRPGDYKYIGSFPHFVADAGDDRVGRWLDERIDLARVYAEIWKDAAPAHLVDVAVFCDSDDTHTASISYFAYVRLERRTLGQLPSRRWMASGRDIFVHVSALEQAGITSLNEGQRVFVGVAEGRKGEAASIQMNCGADAQGAATNRQRVSVARQPG
jgi:hypothetical protein